MQNMLPEMRALMDYDPSADSLLRIAQERELREAASTPIIDDGSFDLDDDD